MLKRIYLSPKGRCSRAFYWQYFVIPFAVLGFLVGVLNVVLKSTVVLVLLPLVLWPSIVIQIKRWHDVGASGWWVLLNFIPYLGWVIWLVVGLIPGRPEPNQYGPSASAASCHKDQ